MVGTGARFFFTLGAFGLLGALAYGLASGGDPTGVISAGYKGGVGDHFGYAVLVATGVAGIVLGAFAIALRDVDPVPVGAGDALPEAPAPDSLSPWPFVGAVGAMITAVGLVLDSSMFVFGLVILAVTVIEWAVKAWADRATGDPEVNAAIRDRFMAPVEVPVAAVIVVGFLAVMSSRVFLAVSKEGAVWIALVALVLIVIGAVLVFLRKGNSGKVAAIALLVLAVLVLAGGIAGIAAGEREFEHHGSEAHSEAEG